MDISAIATDEGWLYPAGVLNLFSRRIVGWAMDEHMLDELTQGALGMAILQRRPQPTFCTIPPKAANIPASSIRLCLPSIAC